MSDIEAEEDLPDTNSNASKIDTKRIFLNQVDTYNGRNIAKVIT